jgi:hypothetical protein
MNGKIVSILLLLVALSPALALAHGHGHVRGVVTAVAPDQMSVKTAESGKVVSVPLKERTKYFKGKAKATLADMTVGSRVVVHLAADQSAEEVHMPAGRKPTP